MTSILSRIGTDIAYIGSAVAISYALVTGVSHLVGHEIIKETLEGAIMGGDDAVAIAGVVSSYVLNKLQNLVNRAIQRQIQRQLNLNNIPMQLPPLQRIPRQPNVPAPLVRQIGQLEPT